MTAVEKFLNAKPTEEEIDQIILELTKIKEMLFEKKPIEEKENSITYTIGKAYDFSKVIKISKEQDKFFDWLLDNDMIKDEVEIYLCFPEDNMEDLTE